MGGESKAMTTFYDEISTWSAEDREDWQERASIIEFGMGCLVSRPEAERMAYDIIKINQQVEEVW
jgi:hypothetical protein